MNEEKKTKRKGENCGVRTRMPIRGPFLCPCGRPSCKSRVCFKEFE